MIFHGQKGCQLKSSTRLYFRLYVVSNCNDASDNLLILIDHCVPYYNFQKRICHEGTGVIRFIQKIARGRKIDSQQATQLRCGIIENTIRINFCHYQFVMNFENPCCRFNMTKEGTQQSGTNPTCLIFFPFCNHIRIVSSPLYVLLELYNDRNWFHDDLSTTLEFLRETSNNVLLDFKSSFFVSKKNFVLL